MFFATVIALPASGVLAACLTPPTGFLPVSGLASSESNSNAPLPTLFSVAGFFAAFIFTTRPISTATALAAALPRSRRRV